MFFSKNKKSNVLYVALSISMLNLACSFVGKLRPVDPVTVGDKHASKAEPGKSEHVGDPELTARDERDLKVSKLWARVDELEEEVLRQKERIVVLERGLTLGLVPEELKYPERSRGNKAARKIQESVEIPSSVATEPALNKQPASEMVVIGSTAPIVQSKSNENSGSAPVTVAPPAKDVKAEEKVVKAGEFATAEERDAYQLAAATAHESFRAGRYGRAIVEYSSIGKKYGDQVGGAMHLYWIAKSWASLKEFNTARQLLTEFIKKHGDSPWAPRAKLDLGRVEWQLGMRESALASFRSVIQQYPLADAAEMARMELESLDKKL